MSLVGKLLDDYDVSGAVDLGHEHDLRMVGAVMYAGKSDLHWNSVQTELTSSADTSAGVETVSLLTRNTDSFSSIIDRDATDSNNNDDIFSDDGQAYGSRKASAYRNRSRYT